MTIRTKRLLIGCLIGIAAGAGSTALVLVLGGKQPDSIYDRAGFVKLLPATAYHAPGSFNTVESERNDSVTLHPTCEINPAEFEDRIIRADALDETLKHALAAGYSIAPAQWGELELSLNLDAVKDIRVSYTHSKVWMLTAQTVRDLRKKYLRGACQEAIVYELKKGYKVCQTKSVIISDVVYRVSLDSNVVTGAEIMDVEVGAGGIHTVEGKQIFHAVKLDEACLLLNDRASVSSDPLADDTAG